MNSAAKTIYVIGMICMFASWLTAMRSYSRLAKAAGLKTVRQTYYSFAVYRYAFTKASGSRDTWLMLAGFVGMFVFLLGTIALTIIVQDALG